MIEFTPEYRAKLKVALAAAGVFLEPDAIERKGSKVILLRGPHRLAQMSAKAWRLVDAEVKRLLQPVTIGGKMPTYDEHDRLVTSGTPTPESVVAGTLRAVEAARTVPSSRRCEVCGGGYRKPRLHPLTRQPCTSPYHRATAPEPS